jgi:hypothetical protein
MMLFNANGLARRCTRPERALIARGGATVSNTNSLTSLPEMPCHTPSVVLGATCLQLLAEGYITSTDLCPRCTTTLMAGLNHAAPESLAWTTFYLAKAAQ